MTTPPQLEHHDVYRDDATYCAWPFNGGLWTPAADEIVVGFHTHDAGSRHERLGLFGNLVVTRSVDAGSRWSPPELVVNAADNTDRLLFTPPANDAFAVDFADPAVMMACWSVPSFADERSQAFITISQDAGRSWGPTRLLLSTVFQRIQGRPDYLVRDDGAVLLFLTARDGQAPHDQPVVYASFDGGVEWTLLSYLASSDRYRMICPSPVLLEDGRMVVAVRCRPATQVVWTEVFTSRDGGRTWSFLSRANDHGDGGHLLRLADGRLLLTYGYRHPPFGIRARTSEDHGATWSPELVIRDDGGSVDLGYPRTCQLSDGRVLAAYYFNDRGVAPSATGQAKTYIAASRFAVP